MIRKILSNIMGPRYYVPLVLFIAGFAILFHSVKAYRHNAHRQLADLATSQKKDETNLQIKEIKAMFSNNPKKSGGYKVIAENNLFSPERKAWSPPNPESGQDEDDKENKDGSNKAKQARQNSIRLYGTTITDSQKTALLYFDSFRSKRKYRLLREGETARDEGERGQRYYFRVESIAPDKVTLQDYQGESLQVGLYEHQRNQKKSAPQPTQATVVIGGMDKQAAQKDTGSADKDSRETAEAGRSQKKEKGSEAAVEKTQDKAQGNESAPKEESGEKEKAKNPFELLKELANQKGSSDMSREEKEEQVKQGNMRKVETPFGTIYRPAD